MNRPFAIDERMKNNHYAKGKRKGKRKRDDSLNQL
jgi:hypothetical protein